MRQSIAAGIVLFNPDNAERTIRCIDELQKQVEKVYIYDNSTVQLSFELPSDIEYITQKENMGLAHALNVIMQKASDDGYEWVITMDQDSIIPNGMVESFGNYVCRLDVGIICPQVTDLRRKYEGVNEKKGIQEVEFCITSASCTRIEAWRNIGGFDDWLFIDLIDNDFCKRMISSKYKIIMLNDMVLNQEFGRIIPKNPKKQQFWIGMSRILHNKNIAKFSYKKEVSPIRVYYTCRNIIYINKKLKKYGKTGYTNYNCKGYFGFLFAFVLPSCFRAKNKYDVIKKAINGTKDGVKKTVVEWSAPVRV